MFPRHPALSTNIFSALTNNPQIGNPHPIRPPPPAQPAQPAMAAPNNIGMANLNNLGFPVNAFQIQGAHDSDEGSEISKIEIKILCPLTITGDANLVAIDSALCANRIAIGVMSALRQISNYGIEMIDENGRPRPINVTVQAQIVIEGSENIIGEAAVMQMIETGATLEGKIIHLAAQQTEETSDGVTFEEPWVTLNGHIIQQQKRENQNGEAMETEPKRSRRN